MSRVHLHTLGCRLNHAESERMARSFRLAGHEIVREAEEADIRIINTCTVTRDAGNDSRRAARPLHAGQRVVVTGCHSQVRPEAFAHADLVVPGAQKETLAALVMERFGMEGLALGMDAGAASDRVFPLALHTTRAFVKIQDGCNLNCSFCLTTLARGIATNRPPEDICAEIRQLAEQGCQEVVLTGVHAGSYQAAPSQDLGWLSAEILRRTPIRRLRYGSLEPWNFRDTWLPLWETFGDRLCRHLHMSLQSGSDTVLRRMRRCYDAATFADKVNRIREAVPDMAITTDLIAGFPGETEAEHQESLTFVRKMRFAGGHVFPYSARPGTHASTLPDQLPAQLRKARARDLQEAVRHSERAYQTAQAQKGQQVLWEHALPDGRLPGLTDTFIRVHGKHASFAWNTLSAVRLFADDDGWRAEPDLRFS